MEPVLAYVTARISTDPKERARLEKYVLRSTVPLIPYLFALYVPHANIKKLQRRVELLSRERGDAKYAYMFARDVNGADTSSLRRLVLKLGDHGWAEAFRRFVTR